MAGNINDLMGINMAVVGAATFEYTVTRGYEVVDIVATSGAGAAGGDTVTPSKAGVALGSALAVAAADIVRYAGTLVDAQATFAAGEVLRMVGNQATVNASVTTLVVPTSWIAG